MRKCFRLFYRCIVISFGKAMAYRTNFILSASIKLLSIILFPLATILIYGANAGYPGWSFWEVMVIQSIFTMSIGIANSVFFEIVWATMSNVVEGTLEIILLKPIDPMVFLMASNVEVDGIGMVLGGMVMFIIALFNVGTVTLSGWIAFVIFFICGILVLLGAALLMAAVSFKWVGNSRIPEIFKSVYDMGMYPQVIFPQAIVVITSYIIPVAMIGFFPASAILNRLQPQMFISIIPCILFMLVGIFTYSRMVRLYEGAGN